MIIPLLKRLTNFLAFKPSCGDLAILAVLAKRREAMTTMEVRDAVEANFNIDMSIGEFYARFQNLERAGYLETRKYQRGRGSFGHRNGVKLTITQPKGIEALPPAYRDWAGW